MNVYFIFNLQITADQYNGRSVKSPVAYLYTRWGYADKADTLLSWRS